MGSSMRYDFISLNMRSPFSGFGFLGLWLPRHSIPSTPSLQFPEKPRASLPSLSFITRSKYWSCAVNILDRDDLASAPAPDDARQEEFEKIPRWVSGPNRYNMRRRPVNSGSKERLRRYSRLLHDCVPRGSLGEGRAIHGHLIRKEIELDSHLWVSLINVYAKCKSLVYARRVLEVMPERNVVSWTTLITGFVAEGYGNDGINFLSVMHREGLRPNEFTIATGLKACSMCLDLEFGKQVHCAAVKLGFLLDLFVGSTLVDLYAKCGEMELAYRLFLGMPQQNAVSWNALLNGFAEIGDVKKVFKLFCGMNESETKFSKFTLSTVLKGCTNSGYVREGQVVHSLAIKVGCEHDEFLSCCLVDMYSKGGLANEAMKVFNKIKHPDVVAWSSIIACLDQQEQRQEVARLFNLMRHTVVRPNQFTLASLVSTATDLGDLPYGKSIHACVYKHGFESDNLIGNALVTMYMKNGCVQDGELVFEAMTDWDSVSWNALLSSSDDHEICDQGPRIFFQMLVSGFEPNMCTFISILRSCSNLLNVGFGKQVHTHIIKNCLDTDNFVQTTLIDMYAKCGCLEDAILGFNRLIRRDLFAWTVIIRIYAQSEQVERTLKCFSQMQREGVKPNEFTLTSCLKSCAHMATMENGRLLHSMAIKAGHLADVYVCGALVDMYGKCGCIEDAEAVFEVSVSRDKVLWNTVIYLYSKYGQGEKVLQAFRMMLDEGIMPDEVTFIGVLAACSYRGLVEEGRRHFISLQKLYGITPTVELYACMVDILGRAGRFTEIESFIKEMDLTPNSLILETILAACRKHGNCEFGQKVAEKLFELRPETDSSYILLSNIFAAKGRWDDVRKVRALMTSRGLKKEPGCSWIEIDGQVHKFMSRDGSHPQMKEIYIKLEGLLEKLISVGYVPKTEDVLLNIADREKVEQLYHHNERLALAFALISDKPIKPIRIFKNTRICGDCHDVMKSLSDIISREIVVRDISCFHHFKSGTCSCQDFW